MAPGKHSRHPDSAYGDDDVDFWAPYTVYVGQDRGASTDTARRISGTSFSSPFVAGAAALIRSIKPELTRRSVLDILHATAGQGFGDVTDFVPVDDAVVRTVGGNRPFDVKIVSPAVDATTQRDRVLGLRVDVSDPDSTPAVTWRVDGDLVATTSGVGLDIGPDTFALGTHEATVTVTDRPSQYRKTRRFTVVNTPALGMIRAPDDDGGVPTFFESSSIVLDATAFVLDVVGRIPATANIRWRVDGGAHPAQRRVTGRPRPRGRTRRDETLPPGVADFRARGRTPHRGRHCALRRRHRRSARRVQRPGNRDGRCRPLPRCHVHRRGERPGPGGRRGPAGVGRNLLRRWSPPGPDTIGPTSTTATTATFRLYMDGCGTTWTVTVVGTEDDGKDPPITGQDSTTFKVDIVC